jgi:hypothetical protein
LSIFIIGNDFQNSATERKISNATSSSSSNTSFDSTLNDNASSSCKSVTGSSSVRSVQSVSNKATLPLSTSPIISSHLHLHHNHHQTLNLPNGISISGGGGGGGSSSLKRKRKNRTAFTANQIFELEKRFSNQRYLSPHDRDRIAYELSLSTAQVITWFQNRRAKQKRDIEELKNDVLAAKSVSALNEDIDVEKVLKSESFKYQFSNFNDSRYDTNGCLSSSSSHHMNSSFINSDTNNDNFNETDNESYSTTNNEEIVESGEDGDEEDDEDYYDNDNLNKISIENNSVKAEIAGNC